MSYLRVKNWEKFQHYKDRRPPWIKLYNDLLGDDDLFMELGELEQWQLVRIWLIASRSSKTTVTDGKEVPVIVNDAQTLQRAIQSLRRVPLAKFIKAGWLIPVSASAVASTDASALLELENHKELQVLLEAPVDNSVDNFALRSVV